MIKTEKLYYLMVALIPFGVLTRITLFPSVNISLSDCIVFLILVLSIKPIVKTITKKRNIFVLLFAVFTLVGVVGVLTHTQNIFEVFSSLSYLVRLTCYLLLIIPFLNTSKKTLSYLRYELVGAGFVFVALGYMQYVYYPQLRNLYYLGWDEHLYRLFSTLLDPNFAGGLIVLVILLYSSLVVNRFKKESSNVKGALVGGYLFLLPALFLTYSRSAYIMALISCVALLFLLRKKKIVLLVLAVFIVGLFLLPKGHGGEGVKLFRTTSILQRSIEYQHGVKIFLDNPVIGIGFDSLRFVSARYGFIEPKNVLVSHSAAGIPNSYLFVLVTTGFTGFLLFLSFILILLKKIFILRRNKTEFVFAGCVVSSLVGVFVQSMFDNSLFYIPILIWVVLLVGILFGENKKETK